LSYVGTGAIICPLQPPHYIRWK